MLNYGMKVYGEPELVKDCIHDVFLNLWTRREGLRPVENVKAYLFTALRMRILERHRQNMARDDRQQKFVQEDQGALLNIEQMIIQVEGDEALTQRLKEAVSKLTKRQREAVYLKFFSGFSNDEIAEIMQVNKQSVYNTISRALKQLEEFLEGRWRDREIER